MRQLSQFHKHVVISAITAVVVHAVMLLMWVGAIIFDFSDEVESLPEPIAELPEASEMTMVLLPPIEQVEETFPEKEEGEAEPEQELEKEKPEEAKAAVVAEAKKAEVPQKEKFAKTSEEQEATPDADTNYIGERNTRAASELPAVLGGAKNLPSQAGKAPLYKGHVETVDRAYKDGSVGADQSGEHTEQPEDKTEGGQKDYVENIPAFDIPDLQLKPDEEIPTINEHLKVGKIIPRNDLADTSKLKPEDIPKDSLTKTEQGGKESELNGEGLVEQDLKKGDFSGFIAKTEVAGSIARKGKSSLNVKNSPLGRYQAKVGKAVELQWRRNCAQHRDHIVPGIISMRFYVDKEGKVSGVKFQEVIEANYIERGFTQRAIRQAKLPPMPKEVLKELKGEPLELVYNFYF